MMNGARKAAAQALRRPTPTAATVRAVFQQRATSTRLRSCGGPGAGRSSRLLSTSGISTEWEGERQSGSGGDELQRGLNPDEIERVGNRTHEMWRDHVALTTEFPDASLPPGGDASSVAPDAVRRKRLIYRSKQRGWLEVDLLLGTWAEKNVAGLSTEDMDRYEDILNLETVDIFNFIAGNAPPPAFVDTPMMARLQEYVKSNPLGQSPASYESAKRESNLT